jgi:hypothetical protein
VPAQAGTASRFLATLSVQVRLNAKDHRWRLFFCDPNHVGCVIMNDPQLKGGRDMQCSTCRFFLADQSQCRRYAPQPTADAKNAHWPVVSASDWCGEYQPAQREAATG